jgi:aminoglycoside phosphotransferase (APT) family kinase protein
VSGQTSAGASLGLPPDDLATEVATALGVTHVDLHPINNRSGSSRTGWLVDSAGLPRLFARIDTGTSGLSGTMYSLAREATILAAIGAEGLPVPRVWCVLPQRDGLVMELVAGCTDLADDLAAEDRVATATAYLRQLSRVHRSDAATLLPSEYRQASTVGEAVAAELARWSRTDSSGPLEDAIRQWLHDHRPADNSPARLLHGDPGAGNLLQQDGRLVAMLDWERAHLGDPLEDRAAVECRSLGRDADDWHAALTATADLYGPPDPAHVVFCRVMWLYTTTMAMGRATRSPIPQARRAAFEARTLENWLICVEQIERLEGQAALPPGLTDRETRTWAAGRPRLRDARTLLADPACSSPWRPL